MSNLITVLETEAYIRDASQIFSKDEQELLKLYLATEPESGAIIPGTGGVRKLRYGVELRGKGKRGGARVIYYFHSVEMPLALLAVYAKGEKDDLSAEEKKATKRSVEAYVQAMTRNPSV